MKVISNANSLPDDHKFSMTPADAQQLTADGVRVFSTGPHRARNVIPEYRPMSEELASLALQIIKRDPVDVVIGWYLMPYCVAAHLTARSLGLPLVVQHAGSDLKRLYGDYALRELLLHILRDADLVMSYPSTVAFFERLGCRSVYRHAPVIPDSFSPLNEPTARESVTLFLGKLSRGKGLDLLIRSFAALPMRRLLIVGTGEHREAYVTQANELRAHNIEFRDGIPIWRIPDLLRSVNAVIVPEWNFGVAHHRSRVPIEALLCGTPAIVSSQITKHYGPLREELLEFDTPSVTSLERALAAVTPEYILMRESNARSVRSRFSTFADYVANVDDMLQNVVAAT